MCMHPPPCHLPPSIKAAGSPKAARQVAKAGSTGARTYRNWTEQELQFMRYFWLHYVFFENACDEYALMAFVRDMINAVMTAPATSWMYRQLSDQHMASERAVRDRFARMLATDGIEYMMAAETTPLTDLPQAYQDLADSDSDGDEAAAEAEAEAVADATELDEVEGEGEEVVITPRSDRA